MRTLELRLEEWEICDWTDSGPVWSPRYHPDKERPISELLQARAALEFFDRALAQGMAGCMDPAPHSGGDVPGKIFEHAAALTFLRFGVRIVGLAEQSDKTAGQSALWRCSVCLEDIPGELYGRHMAVHGKADDRPEGSRE